MKLSIPLGTGATPVVPPDELLLAHTVGQSVNNNSVTTPSIDTTGATVIVVVAITVTVDPASSEFTDSKSNTWLGGPYRNQSYLAGRILYCASPATDAAHTFSFSHTGSYPALAVAAFDTVTGTADVAVGAGCTGPWQPGADTPGSDNQLVVTGLGYNTTATVAVDSDFVITDNATGIASAVAVALAYKVQESAAELNPSWTGLTSGNIGVVFMESWS